MEIISIYKSFIHINTLGRIIDKVKIWNRL